MNSFDFDKTAKLSHLEFSESEKHRFIKDMQEMLSLADSLCALDKEDTVCALHENIISLEKDEERVNDCKSLLDQSKRNDSTFIIVPSSIDDGGSL